MPEDTYTEVTRQSWGSRLGGSFKGIVLGFILIALAFWLLFWNEGRAVRRQKTLAEGGGLVVSVASERVDPTMEGRLVHMSGLATTGETLVDSQFGISVNAIHLERQVEMYQWRESEESRTEKKLGGGTETTTTYSYNATWSDRVIDSSSFKVPEGHQNPGAIPYGEMRTSAQSVTLGAFRLSPGLIAKMRQYQPLTVRSLEDLPYELRWQARLHDGGLFIGADPSSPEIGDVKVSFRYVVPETVSIVAQQSGDSFSPYYAEAGGSIELLHSGVVSADAMFTAAEKSNRFTTWIYRIVGFCLMLFGIKRLFRPLSVLADVVPAVGNMVEAGSSVVAFFLAAFLSLITIAVAWLRYRPMIGLLVLALAIVAGIGLIRLLRKAARRLAVAKAPAETAPS